jgi:hypothetical protein
MAQLFAVMRTRGSAWNDSVPMDQQVDWRRHADFMNELEVRDIAVLAGPLDGTRDVLLVFRAEDEARGRGAAGRGLLECPGPAADALDQALVVAPRNPCRNPGL